MNERFQPPQGIADAKTSQALSDVSKSLDAAPRLSFAPISASAVSVAPGEIKRLNPRSGGMTAVLQTAAASNAGMSCALFVSGPGALTVAPASGTINGASQLVFAAGTYSLELFSDGSTWLTPGLANGSVVNAQLADMAAATVKGRALGAGTGDATDLTGAQVLDILEPNAAVWTAQHTFNGALVLGTLHSLTNQSGAINVTLPADATRIVITSTATVTIGTISGAADGRMCVIEHVRASGAGDLVLTHATGADETACPGSVNLTLGQRGCCILVSRGTTWRVMSTTN